MSKSSRAQVTVPVNILWLVAGRVSGDACLLIFYVALSRLFGQVGIGHYAFAMSLTGIFAYFADFGLHRFSVRTWPRSSDEFPSRLGEVLALRLVLMPIVGCLLLLFAEALGLDGQQRLVVFVVGLHQILFTLADGLLAAFVAHQESRISSLLDLSGKVLTVVVGMVLIMAGADLPIVLVAMPLSTVCLLIIAALTVHRRYGTPVFTLNLAAGIRTATAAWPSFLSVSARQISIRTDVVLLGLLMGPAAAGIYSVGQRVVWMLVSIPGMAAVGILPRASILHLKDKERLSAFYSRSVNLAILLGVPAAAGIFLVAADIIDVIFGPEFTQAVPVLRILSLYLLLSVLRNVGSAFLSASDLEGARARVEWTGAALGLGFQLLLIPLYGVVGAAIAVVLMEASTTLIVGFLVTAQLGLPRIMHRLLMASLGSMAFSLAWLSIGRPPLYFAVPLAVAVYVGFLMTSRSIRREDFSIT